MVSLSLFVSSVLFTTAWGAPAADQLKFPPLRTSSVLCSIPFLGHILCPRDGTSMSVNTAIGVAQGTVANGAARFSVKYASAARWQDSSVATTWELPNGSTDVSAMPLMCPQPGANSSTYSEDCLSMVLYVPTRLKASSKAPVIVWIHGGSFLVGSASDAGLDGSKLAIASNSIVAVIQYRLGALGFMAPSGETNLAVKDVITALNFLQKTIPSFGGNTAQITLAGQSAGANMIRALLAVPSAASLFNSAILHSDPMVFGFLNTTIQSTMQSYFNNDINCSATDTSCQNALSLDTIINSEMDLFSNAINIAPAAGNAEPIRPVRDGSLITSPLDSTAPFPSVSKPVMVTSVLNEAGSAIYASFTSTVPESNLEQIMVGSWGQTRTDTILASPFYPQVVLADGQADARTQLQVMGTDFNWKCAAWTFTRNWVTNGGKAFVGVWTLGATYPGNNEIPYCTESGVVCHQDDIQIVFGTVSNPTEAQSALIAEAQARYKAFVHTGNPNAPSLPQWNASSASNVNVHNLGNASKVTVGACVPTFWGDAVQYDYQIFGI